MGEEASGMRDYDGWSYNRPYRKAQEIACKERRLAKMRDDPGDPLHGTPTGYNYGCRCERCASAKRRAVYRWRFKRRARERMDMGYMVCDVNGEPIMVCADEKDARRALEVIEAAKTMRQVLIMKTKRTVSCEAV